MTKTRPALKYCVPPLLVHDLASQCAAYFLIWFSDNSDDHIKDVLKRGLGGEGGLVDEVEYWFQNCTEDASTDGSNSGYWDPEVDGPWTYANIDIASVAQEVWDHTRGWKSSDFELYGMTVESHNEHLAVMRAAGPPEGVSRSQTH